MLGSWWYNLWQVVSETHDVRSSWQPPVKSNVESFDVSPLFRTSSEVQKCARFQVNMATVSSTTVSVDEVIF
jgi:hypothetical protein